MSKQSRKAKRAAALTTVGTQQPTVSGAEHLTHAPRVGGRLSLDNNLQIFGNTPIILPPVDYESGWRTLDLDTKSLDRVSPTKLIEYLANLSPEMSRALWDFLRQCNPGHTIRAYAARTQTSSNPDLPATQRPDARAQTVVDAFLTRLKVQHGAVDVLLARLFVAAFMRGAFMAEVVLDEAGREAVDLATPDPATIRFRRYNDPVRGPIWQPGQWQWGGFVPLDRPTILYIPIDPFPGSPYGRSPAAPGVFPALFLLGLLHDLRRVVAQQGWPRLDIAVDLEKLKSGMPANVQSDPAKYRQWVDDAIGQIEGIFADLPPDAAFVHVNSVTVNRPVGAVDSSSLSAVNGIIDALERMLARALKTMPLLMGIAEGTAESQANRQAEAHYQSIRAFQHLCEQLLEQLLTVMLQAAGVPGVVEVRFAENRASEELRDAQTQQLKLANARTAYDNGLIDQDGQAKMALGIPKADQQEPRVTGGTNAGALTASLTSQPEPSVNRAASPTPRASTPLTRATSAKRQPEGQPLPDVPETRAIGADDSKATPLTVGDRTMLGTDDGPPDTETEGDVDATD